MFSRLLPSSRPCIDAGRLQPLGRGLVEQQMVDTQPGIALERAPPIFPEAIDGLTRVQTADRVGPSLFQQPMIGRFRSEEHTSELQSLMRISYAVFCLKKKKQ